jgi:TolB-like protein
VSGARNLDKQITNIAIVPTIGQAALVGSSELNYHEEKIQKNIVVTSMVDVNNFEQSSDFGRLFSESMIANFKRLGWNVLDFRGKFVSIEKKRGEFYLSRENLKKFPADSVIFVGTYGEYQNGLLLNMRILDMSNQVITASSVQLNDQNALELSKKSQCNDLRCKKLSASNSSKKTIEQQFSIGIKKDDCKNVARCECKNPDNCLCQKECR